MTVPMVEGRGDCTNGGRDGCLCQWWKGRGDCANGGKEGVTVPMVEREG